MNPWLHRREVSTVRGRHALTHSGGGGGGGGAGWSAWGCAVVLWVCVGGVCVQASWCAGGARAGGLHRGAADWRPLGVTRDRACEVDMREVSWRPVRSEDEMLTGAPLCRRMLTFLSFSIPV